jgi:glycolate oxidase FAD binding subunit
MSVTRAASSAPVATEGLPVIEPADAAELARALAEAWSAGRAVLPRGGGTKSDWGNPPRRADVILSTKKLNRVLEHAAGDMTATVEAGCTITDLQNQLALRGQRLAIDPLWPDRATVGGVLATNDNGSLRGAFGSLRDLVLGVTVALPDGTLTRSGGKVVKNVAGYDLPKLMVGALGTLGVITEATFRLHPIPRAAAAALVIAPDFSAACAVAGAVQDSTIAPAGVEVRADDASPPVFVAVWVEGSPEAVEAQWHALYELATCRGCFVGSYATRHAREKLFLDGIHTAVCKVTFPAARLADLCNALSETACGADARWDACLEGVGVGWFRITTPGATALPKVVESLRAAAVSLGGSLALLQCPAEVRQCVDAWGDVGDALPLMRRVKQQFDPTGCLNPGRFVGGI